MLLLLLQLLSWCPWAARDDDNGYLNRFGYIDSSPSQEGTDEEPRVYAQQQHRKTEDMIGGDLTLDSIRSAVRKFQEFAGLPTTGNLDNRTRKKMAQPRCGMQDVQMLTSAGGVLAHATFPQDGKLHFDDDENWVFMDGNKIGNHRFTDMYWVALHEIGHVLGLSHSNIETAIMAPFYQDPRDLVDWRGNYKTPELTQDDTRAAQQIYGKRYGRIGTSSSADRSDRNPSVGGGRRKSATYDDRQGGFWSQLGKMFSSEDGNDANINNNDDRPTTHHGSNGRYHNRRDHHHRHNYEREYAEMDNSATGHFAKIHIANMLFAAIFTFIMAKLFIL
uniref:Peptidase metallopeptidase domain-containing protein n=1 Tax=Globodera rostochiensis TaxID=31243 RepID=A0A914H837_GLORO